MRRLRVLCIVGFVAVVAASAASGATFEVNNLTTDSDDDLMDDLCDTDTMTGGLQCSLRAALQQANATVGVDTIEFNITGCGGVCTIVDGGLPTIREGVTIDGYSQTGASVNTLPLRASNAVLLIELDGCLTISHFVSPTQASEGTTIQGLAINGCGSGGISMSTPYNTIQGNFIGTTPDGTAVSPAPNGSDGISATIVSGNPNDGFNLIGGFLPEEWNVISGNGGDGIDLNSEGNLVMGNIIGTDALGLVDLGNFNEGIVIRRDGNQIGIDVPLSGRDLPLPATRGNLISGNRFNGVSISSDDNTLMDNVIGPDSLQTSALPNDDNGVRIQTGTGNRIGIEVVGFANIISGNGEHGVHIINGDDNSVSGNLVGITFDPNLTLYAAMGNGCDGIRVTSDGNTIGGSLLPGMGNYVGGNIGCGGDQNGPGHGIHLSVAASDNEILGNWVGLDPNGLSRPNAADGISIINTAQRNQIGDGSEFGANLIGSNGPNADDLAIDLDNDGRDINDPMDPDGDPNDTQNYPVITTAVTSGGSTTINGTLNSTPTQSFVIDVFSSLAGQPGQARAYEGTVTTGNTDANGDVAWSLSPSFALPAGTLITATATPEPTGNPEPTSELSDPVAVTEPGELQFTMMAYSNPESGTATIAVERVNGSDGMVSVQYASSDGSATDPADYTGVAGMLMWADGDTMNKTFDVPIAADTIDELDETVNLSLSGPSGGAILGSPSMATLTILDDDNPPSLSIGDVMQVEGNAGTTNFDFAVTLDGPSGLQIDVDFATMDGTATTADNDYVATMNSLTFLPGETMMTASVPVNGDGNPEADETFTVDLSMPVNAGITTGSGTGTILDDDTTPEFSVDDVMVTEGDVGTTTLTFTVTLSPTVGTATSVDVATADGSATAPADYVAIGTTTVAFPANAATQPVVVTVNNDFLDEIDETLFLDLSNPQGGTAIADGQGIGTIQDNDAAPSIDIGDVSQPEGNAGTTAFDFVVSLDAPSGQLVTVDFMTADGTATTGDNDYQPLMGTVNFVAGDTMETVTVLVNGDGTSEMDEDFSVNLTNGTNGTINDGQGTGTIQDDDSGPVFSIDDVTVVEGDAGTVDATFTVSLMPAAGVATSVQVDTANGSATAAADYTAVSTVLNFGAGQTSQTVVVPVIGDTTDEIDETYFVDLSNPTGGVMISDPQGLGTITDDDPVPSASIQDISQVEGDVGTSTFDFMVSLSEASGLSITIDFATADGTATIVDLDYVAAAGTLTFLPGETVQLAAVTVNGDATVEPSEVFFVDLSAPTNVTLSDNQATGTIVDDDGMPQAFIDDVIVVEGDAGSTDLTFTVSLSMAAAVPVSVDYATADGTAQDGLDYTGGSGTVSFLVGMTTAQILVPVLGDLTDEFDETLVVDLSNPIGVGIADNQGQGVIMDDDPLPEVGVPAFQQVEGDAGNTSFDIPITLSEASGKTVSVDWATVDGTATAAGGDYLPAMGSVTFLPGETSQVASVLVAGDLVTEGTETFTIALTNPVEAQVVAGSDQVSILGDDGMPVIEIPTLDRVGLLLLGLVFLGLGLARIRR